MASSGVIIATSPESYTYGARVSVGQAAGSTPITRTALPWILSHTNGNAMPAKLEPPPTQPMTTSG